jgi:hypothetical protein
MSGYPNLDQLCKAFGFHGVCPEGLEVVGRIPHLLNDEVRAEYRAFMDDLAKMFAPVEKESADD